MSRNPDTVTPAPGSVELPDASRDTRPAPSGTRRASEANIAERPSIVVKGGRLGE